MERSRGYPLDIRLVFHPEFDQAQRLFDLLRDECERWATFKFHLPGGSHTPFRASAVSRLSLRPNPSSSFAALRQVDVNRLSDIPGGLDLLMAFGNSSLLTKLVLFDVKYVEEVFARLPWSQLTHFVVKDFERCIGYPERTGYPDHFPTEVLSKSPNLKAFGTWKYSWTRILPLEPRSHPDSLSTIIELDLYGWTPTQSEPGHGVDDMDISSLHLPSLRHLTLRKLGNTSNDLNSITKMIERSSCRLLSVSLLSVTLLDVTVKRFLSVSGGSLRKIVMRGRIIGPTLLECFFSHSSQTDWHPLLPHLEELNINRLMLADLEPYDRVLGLEMPFSMSRFHRQLRIHVISTKNSVASLTTPVPNEIELLQELGMALVSGTMRINYNAPGALVENMSVVDCILTYLEKYHGSEKSIIQHATTKLGTLRCYLQAIGDMWGNFPEQEEFRLVKRARLLFDPFGRKADWSDY
ncbi:hypothetical protein AAF712_015373 [Marasmius tenuissimus]|uniref:F-box domain-containing protein n=1 Tax=Marasmius tenuissimus TaxID=585030 RepID=A0ABR2Z9S6_9AGAR